MVNPEEDFAIKEIIRRIALINAISHKGKAQTNPVLGKLLSEKPELKKRIGTLTSLINEVVQEINEMSLDKQREIVSELWPEMLAKEKEKVEEKKLPPLPNVEKYRQVVTRFAPNPDCVLHLGSARAIILSHEYARIYNGVFILRFEDTDPRLKKSALQFFDLIRRDLEWLGCNWDAEYIQSDRIEIYYEYAEKLLENGYAFVCICKPEEFRELIKQKRSCLCRNLPKEEHLSRWDAMLNGEYEEGEAVVRIKTDLDHPNPAIRDWPAFRVIDTKKYPHPRIGSKYRVWPLYNFASGIDDHLMSVSHIIRGKEHLTNQRRQEYLYRYLGWEYPEAMHYGRLKIEGASLSKSKILRGVKEGTYKGWDDP
ncbi:MAG: glutamate--tRNA ligase, partial [Candidatus Bathyarchaeia archaeon]